MRRLIVLPAVLALLQGGPAFATDRVRVAARTLRKGDTPFFPIGFVSGTTDAELTHAKELGANSVHAEYSLRDVLPFGPQISPDGIGRIRETHARVARSGLTFFPLVNAHYLPEWLTRKAAGPPRDLNGQPVGFWFGESIHDPVFRKSLETYWTAIAGSVGADPNVGAFVSWNEPAYGLDATPSAVEDFRGWLMLRYGPVRALNAALGLKVKTYAQVKPPRTPDENRALWYAWASFHQESFADFFSWERSVFRKASPEAQLSGKHPAFTLTGDARFVNEGALQMRSQDVSGTDIHGGSLLQFRDALEAARSASGSQPVMVYETHPQHAHAPSSPAHSALQLFAQIIGGARGLFFYSYGTKEADFGFESDKGTPPEVRSRIQELLTVVSREQALFAAPRQPAEIAVVLSMPSAIHYGMGADPTTRDEYSKRVIQTFDLLRNQHFAVDFLWDRMLVPERLKQYKLIVLPSLTILKREQLAVIEGRPVLAFGGSLDRDELFQQHPLPSVLGLKSRGPAKWDRGFLRLTEVIPDLVPYFDAEITVQRPELINEPARSTVPGSSIAPVDTQALVAGQDGQPMIRLSEDRRAVYCAFDSLYSEELSQLLGGIVDTQFGLRREVTVRNLSREATEILTAVSENEAQTFLLIANAGPKTGQWLVRWPQARDGTWRSARTGATHTMVHGEMPFPLAGYGWDALSLEPR